MHPFLVNFVYFLVLPGMDEFKIGQVDKLIRSSTEQFSSFWIDKLQKTVLDNNNPIV